MANSVDSLSPMAVPPGFAKPSGSYRFHAWMAVVALILFLLLYVGLAGWFTWTTYRMITGVFVGGEGSAAAFFTALPCGFLAIFMWKALFFVRRGSDPGVEITIADQPELFAFLHDLADEIRAPRPHRVFLSPNVNAAVFYDLSILNFFLPSKKNLIIGVGLINVLNRSEFKAVLAHEFGHFAQRSMAIGRWVYVGEQIAGHIIAKRDFLDKALNFISAIDLRIAWIGWIMRTIVWSIRSLMEAVFRWVVIAHRALSREMEFQADLVAVSVTGSDALINGLYHLGPADEDWQLCLDFVNDQLRKQRIVTDLIGVSSQISRHMRRVMNDPSRGLVVDCPADQAAARRLFTEQIAQPPRMWSTHPSNCEREENAKRVYIAAPLDDRSAWTLFQNQQEIREAVTKLLFEGIEFEKKPEPLSSDEVAAAVDEQYDHEAFQNAYQGAYVGRTVTLGVTEPQEMYETPPADDQLAESLGQLYPESLRESMALWRSLEEEIASLQAIADGYAEASGGVIRHRGEVVTKSELAERIAQIKQERDEVLADIEKHDRRCRTVHHAAAGSVARGWPEYLQSLARLLHYAEHSEADVGDAHGQLANVTAMATASGHVSSRKLKRILDSANELQRTLAALDSQAEAVKLPPSILHDIEAESWREALDKLELPPANEQNIGQWIQVVDSWAIPMRNSFGSLRRAALAELLKAEHCAADLFHQGDESKPAPASAVVPGRYATRLRGTERARQKKLDWWSRFTLADGTGPAIMRFAVAASIVLAVVLAGLFVGDATLIVYNGLATSVDVRVNDQWLSLLPSQHRSLTVGCGRRCSVVSQTRDGREIEAFNARMGRAFANYVYNVAGAAPMIEWTATYGNASEREPDILGCPRWRVTSADYIFKDPPNQISTSGSGGTRKVLSSDAALHPQHILHMMTGPAEQERVTRAHARWDAPDARYISHWLSLASRCDGFDQILADRFNANPKDVPALRVQQDTVEPEAKDDVLRSHRELGEHNPDDPDCQYIAIRAQADGPEQNEAFYQAFLKWPHSVWLGNAAGYAHACQAEWTEALEAFEVPLRSLGPCFDSAALQVARIRRFTTKETELNLNDLSRSTEVAQMLALESGTDFQGSPLYAYSLLNKGQLQDAYRAAGGNEAESQLLVLLAASEGADADWQQQAFRIPLEDINDQQSLLYLAALAHRNGQPHEPYLARYQEKSSRDKRSPLEHVRRLIDQGDPAQLNEDQLNGLDPLARGTVLTAAIILYPDQAEESWRRTAKALLFALERPAFKSGKSP